MRKQPVDKDSIISGLQQQAVGLQAKIDELRGELAEVRADHKRIRETSDANYQSAVDWKKTAEERARQIEQFRKERAEVADQRQQAERDLRFAEGYIAALKGEAYQTPTASDITD